MRVEFRFGDPADVETVSPQLFSDVLNMAYNRLADRQKELTAQLTDIDLGDAEEAREKLNNLLFQYADAEESLDKLGQVQKVFSKAFARHAVHGA